MKSTKTGAEAEIVFITERLRDEALISLATKDPINLELALKAAKEDLRLLVEEYIKARM